MNFTIPVCINLLNLNGSFLRYSLQKLRPCRMHISMNFTCPPTNVQTAIIIIGII